MAESINRPRSRLPGKDGCNEFWQENRSTHSVISPAKETVVKENFRLHSHGFKSRFPIQIRFLVSADFLSPSWYRT